MPGRDFTGFLTLSIIRAAVSGILHFEAKYDVLPGFRSFCSKVVVGYVGAWLGTPALGYLSPARFEDQHAGQTVKSAA